MSKFLILVFFIFMITSCNKLASPTESDVATRLGSAMAANGSQIHGTGVIKALNRVTGTVIIEHESIIELNWLAMTTGFSGTPTILNNLTVGDRVKFEFRWDGEFARLKSITKQ